MCLFSQPVPSPEVAERDKKHHESFRVNSHDVDINGNARPSVVLRYTQECAALQHDTNPPTLDQLRAENKAFILSKVTVNVYEQLKSRDEIDVWCWLAQFKGNSLNRYSQIFRGETLVCETAALWAMVDTETRRLIRPTPADMGFGCSEPLELEIPRLHFPKELSFESLGTRRIDYSDIDVNRHMNNTNYPDMLLDALPSDAMIGRKVTKMTLSYLSEAPLGDTIEIFHASNGSLANVLAGEHGADSGENRTEFFRTSRGDGRCGVEAVFNIADC